MLNVNHTALSLLSLLRSDGTAPGSSRRGSVPLTASPAMPIPGGGGVVPGGVGGSAIG